MASLPPVWRRALLTAVLPVVSLPLAARAAAQDTARPAARPRSAPGGPAPSARSAADVRRSLETALAVTGTATPGIESQTLGLNTQSWLRWKLDINVKNGTPHRLAFGNDLLLVEANAESTLFDGVHLVVGAEDEPVGVAAALARPGRQGTEYYGVSNSERRSLDGGTFQVLGGTMKFTIPGSKPQSVDRDFGTLAPGKVRSLKLDLDQGVWVKDENRTSVRVVLPAITAGSGATARRFRLIVYFDRPAEKDKAWRASRKDVVPLEAGELGRLVSIPETNLVTRVLAANWLAEVAPGQAGDVLVPLAQTQRQGQLLATALLISRDHGTPGLESHAAGLLADSGVPNGVRRHAALYLGAVRAGAAFDALVAASTDKDDVVARSALEALGQYGGEAVVPPLASVLKDEKVASDRRARAARSLAQTRLPSALAALEEAAATGSEAAIDALVDAPSAESFDFLLGQLRDGKHPQWEARLLGGLRKANPDRALAVFMERLASAEPPDPKQPWATSSLVDELVKAKPAATIPEMARMAGEGNLRALQVLAGSKDEAFRAPLLDLAAQARGPALRIALKGLVDNWPSAGLPVYRSVLAAPDAAEAVELAGRGLEKAAPKEVGAALAALLPDADPEIARSSAQALGRLDRATPIPDLLPAILAATDRETADRLAGCLIQRKWADRGATHRLGARLKEAPAPARYPLVRLLRHLSNDAMGPGHSFEFDKDPDGWTSKWIAWADGQAVSPP